MLSWLAKVLSEHEPADDLSFDAIATRFTAVVGTSARWRCV